MTKTTLRAVTLQTVANYRHAAEGAVGAYRTGGHRLAAVMQRGVDQAATRGAQRISPRLAAAIQRAGRRMSSLVVKGVDAVSIGTERAIRFSATGVTSQVERVAVLADGVESSAVASSLQAAVRFSLPGAQVALLVSERVATGADKLQGTVAGARGTRVKAATVTKQMAKAAAPVEVKAKVRVKKAAKAVTEKAAATTTAVTPVVKPARRRAKAVTQAVQEVAA